MQKQRGNKGKEKTDEFVKVVKTYTTISVEKKLFRNAIKARKSVKTKRRRLKKRIVVDEEYVEVVNMGEEEEFIDIDIAALIEKRRKKVQEESKTSSSQAKQKTITPKK